MHSPWKLLRNKAVFAHWLRHASRKIATRAPFKTYSALQETPDGVYLEPRPDTADHRTAAEKQFDEQAESRQADRIAKMTAKSHRQRVAEFNEHLGKLTEHMVSNHLHSFSTRESTYKMPLLQNLLLLHACAILALHCLSLDLSVILPYLRIAETPKPFCNM